MKQTVETGDQVVNQPLVRQEIGLAESRPSQIASISQQPRQQRQGNQRKRDTSNRQYIELNMPMSQVLQHMLKLNLVTLKYPSWNPNTSAPTYNPDAICAYHSSSPGHDTDSCWTLKYKIQDLIDEGELEFIQDGQLEFFCHSSEAHHLK